MNISLVVLLGIISGTIASLLDTSERGIIGAVILGVVGAFIGIALKNMFLDIGLTFFPLNSSLIALLSAGSLLFLGKIFENTKDIQG